MQLAKVSRIEQMESIEPTEVPSEREETSLPKNSAIHDRIVRSGLLGRLGLNQSDVLTVITPKRATPSSKPDASSSSISSPSTTHQTRVMVLGNFTRGAGDSVARPDGSFRATQIRQSSPEERDPKAETFEIRSPQSGPKSKSPPMGPVPKLSSHGSTENATGGRQRLQIGPGLRGVPATQSSASSGKATGKPEGSSNAERSPSNAWSASFPGFGQLHVDQGNANKPSACSADAEAVRSERAPIAPGPVEGDSALELIGGCDSSNFDDATGHLDETGSTHAQRQDTPARDADQRLAWADDVDSIDIDGMISQIQDLAAMVADALETRDSVAEGSAGVRTITPMASFTSNASHYNGSGFNHVDSFVVTNDMDDLLQDLRRTAEHETIAASDALRSSAASEQVTLAQRLCDEGWRDEVNALQARIKELLGDKLRLEEQVAVAREKGSDELKQELDKMSQRATETSVASESSQNSQVVHRPVSVNEGEAANTYASNTWAGATADSDQPKCYLCRSTLFPIKVGEHDGTSSACTLCRRQPPNGAKVWRCECGRTFCIRCTLVTGQRTNARSNRPATSNAISEYAINAPIVNANAVTPSVPSPRNQDCSCLADRCIRCGTRLGLLAGLHGLGIFQQMHEQRCLRAAMSGHSRTAHSLGWSGSA